MESALLIKRREAIILAAIDEINKCGIQAVSTKEIARKQGVSERIIFNYFPTKNTLLAAVIDHFSKYDNAILQTVKSKSMDPVQAITYFFESYSTYYENYPAITALTQSYDILQNSAELGNKMKGVFKKHEAFIMEQIEAAKRTGLINADTDCESMANMLSGTFTHLCLKWRLQEYNFSLKDKTLLALQTILK